MIRITRLKLVLGRPSPWHQTVCQWARQCRVSVELSNWVLFFPFSTDYISGDIADLTPCSRAGPGGAHPARHARTPGGGRSAAPAAAALAHRRRGPASCLGLMQGFMQACMRSCSACTLLQLTSTLRTLGSFQGWLACAMPWPGVAAAVPEHCWFQLHPAWLCMVFHASLGAPAPGVAAHQRTRRQGRVLSYLYLFFRESQGLPSRHQKGTWQGVQGARAVARFGRSMAETSPRRMYLYKAILSYQECRVRVQAPRGPGGLQACISSAVREGFRLGQLAASPSV